MTVNVKFLPQPCTVCLPTELHQELQGQAYRQTSVLPQPDDKPLPHGRTRLWLRLSSAPHGPHWTPGSHLRRQNAPAAIQPHDHTHSNTIEDTSNFYWRKKKPELNRANWINCLEAQHVGPMLVFSPDQSQLVTIWPVWSRFPLYERRDTGADLVDTSWHSTYCIWPQNLHASLKRTGNNGPGGGVHWNIIAVHVV